MAKVEPHEILDDILAVLASAARGKGKEPGFLTAYQIYCRLPQLLRERLVAEYGEPGKENGAHFTAASRVAQVAASAPDVEQRYFDTGGLQFSVGGLGEVEAGFNLCAIFRLAQ